MVDASKPCLDIGCGSSRILGALPEHSVGLDVEQGKLLYARRYSRSLVHGSAFALPFPNKTFEQVVCSQVIEHLPAGEQPFAEMTRVLRDGGHLVLGTPDYDRLSWRFFECLYGFFAPGAYADQHITHYTRDDLIRRMAAYGLHLKRTEYVLNSEMILLFERNDTVRPGQSAALLAQQAHHDGLPKGKGN
jgi:SAM-dependent methyltransferase